MSIEASPPVTRDTMNTTFLPKISKSHMESKLAGISKAPKRSCVKKMLKPRFPISKYRLKMERFSENLQKQIENTLAIKLKS